MRRANAITAANASASAADTQRALAETRRSNDLTQRQVEAAEASLTLTRESNEFTRDSLQVAQASLELSRRSFELAHQPVINILKPDTVRGNSSADGEFAITLVVQNSGRSGAHDTVLGVTVKAGSYDISEAGLHAALPCQQRLGFVAAGAEIPATATQPLTQDLRQANAHGNIQCLCSVRYEDDFGGRHRAAFLWARSGSEWVIRDARIELLPRP
jgi:hypothetical protein